MLAERIAREERGDESLAVLAALFHDIAHGAEIDGKDDHELRSAAMTRQQLHSMLSEDSLNIVCEAISGRRFAKRQLPRSAAGAILDDADNIDAIGLTGMARAFLWIGEHSIKSDDIRAIENYAWQPYTLCHAHWEVKLQRLAPAMRTATGTRLAADRHDKMRQFLDGLSDEMLATAGPL